MMTREVQSPKIATRYTGEHQTKTHIGVGQK